MTNPSLTALAPEQAIRAQFASRPTLQNVVWQLLSDAISRQYPTINLDQSLTRVAMPISLGHAEVKSLIELTMGYLASGSEPDFRDIDGQPARLVDETLIIKLSSSDEPSVYPDMGLIKHMIVELPWTLAAELQNQLAAYWGDLADTGVSRWQWLSDRLLDTLRISAIEQAGLDELEREAVEQLVNYPNLEQRTRLFGASAVHAYCPELVVTHGTLTIRQLIPVLLLVRTTRAQTRVLLCNPSGVCESFVSVDAFTQVWGHRMVADYDVAQIKINRYEPDGNIFDSHAATVLNQQLENLQTLPIPSRQGGQSLQALYWDLTEPGHYFLKPDRALNPVLNTLQGKLPIWLIQASAADRMAYRHYSLLLASAKQRSQGRTFLSDIPDIVTFSREALLKQLKLDESKLGGTPTDQSDAEHFHPEDLQLTFTRSAGYPGGSGITETFTMNLTDLAIKNLAGQPGVLTSIKHAKGSPLPAWLTLDYIKRSDGLIEQVDIGKTYPQLLKARLLGEDQGITERIATFARQTTAQLPLEALELKLSRQNGLTEQGVRYVRALLSDNAQARHVDGQAVTIRELALVRKPGAAADVVTNMFIIEAQSIEVGPHLLYRPLYAEPLHEFATRSQLLKALAEPGELQDSVLTWLSDAARPIYDNGGFNSPHYLRFGQGSDFDAITVPTPATLATEDSHSELPSLLSNDSLMQYLYGSTVRALVDQADRESTSNSESRWAVMLEGASLLFNTLLLPFLRSPFMLTGWLISLTSSASQDIPALNSPDPITRELALIDMLLNVGMLLLQLHPASPKPPQPLDATFKPMALKLSAPRRMPEQWPEPTPARVREGVVAMEGDFPSLQSSLLDFSYSNTRARLTPSQSARLAKLRVPMPEELPPPVSVGPLKGLYVINDNWFAKVDEHWYRIDIKPDNTVVIIFPSDSTLPGPMLKSDGTGRWSLDLNLRLRGGMPKSRLNDLIKKKNERKIQLLAEYQQLLIDQPKLQADTDAAQQAMERLENTTTRRAFENTLQTQTQRFVKLLDTFDERHELNIAIAPETQAIVLSNTVKNARKLVVLAHAERTQINVEYKRFIDTSGGLLQSILAHRDNHKPFIDKKIETLERELQALELRDKCLARLSGLGSRAAESYAELTENRSDERTILGVKYLKLQTLKYSTFKNLADFPTELSDILDPLAAQVHTHIELNRLELPADERLQVLRSLCDRYGQAIDALQGQATIYADELDMPRFNQVQKILEELYRDATEQLIVQIKPDARQPAPHPKPPSVKRVKSQRTKVIKTRRQGTLIGESKPANLQSRDEVVEVRYEFDAASSTTYSLKDGQWEDSPKKTSAAPITQAARELNTVRNTAKKRLNGLEQFITREAEYAQKSRFPKEIEENLEREAMRYRELASELRRQLQNQPESSQQPGDQQLLDRLTGAAATLANKGQAWRIERSLALPPTNDNVEFLLELGEVNVTREEGRQKMLNDYIQEYFINNRQGNTLWSAHFHYSTAQMSESLYNIAHMKLYAERKQSYYSLLKKAKGQAVEVLHRGDIGRQLAQRWFLSAAP